MNQIQQDKDFDGILYAIEAAYRMADRYLQGSDQWHEWMDKAKKLEEKVREPKF